MATKDLRYFEFPEAQQLPDGRPRWGISVVAALSEWLIHTNHRRDGSWTRRYEHGMPITDLLPHPWQRCNREYRSLPLRRSAQRIRTRVSARTG